MVLSLYLEARIWILIKIKGRIRIRIKVTSSIRIHIKVTLPITFPYRHYIRLRIIPLFAYSLKHGILFFVTWIQNLNSQHL
jgi:hypothetical protein